MATTRDGKRTFAMIDHIITRDDWFGELADSDQVLLLLYYYVSPNNLHGIVTEGPWMTGQYTKMPPERVVKVRSALEDSGHIVTKGPSLCLLTNWRTWIGGNKYKDPRDNLLLVTKKIVQDFNAQRNAYDDAFALAYAESCGFKTEKDMLKILDEPDPHNRGRKPKAEGNVEDSKKTQKKGAAKEDKHPKLTTQIADEFAKAFLGRKKYGRMSKSAHDAFRKSGDKIISYYENSSTFTIDKVLDMLIKVCKGVVEDGLWKDVNPGNLCCDYVWKDAFPKYLKRVLDK